MNNKFVVITSINRVTDAVRAFSAWTGWTTIVVGDRKSPQSWEFDGVVYLSLEDQLELFPDFCRNLYENSYTRKMVGYLYAFSQGAQAIFDTDDDNIPYSNAESVIDEHLRKPRVLEPALSSGYGWVNIYEYFGAPQAWPRGYPLHMLNADRKDVCEDSEPALPWGALQYLADSDPDVDAIYRMTRGEEVYFARQRECSLAKRTFSPFNSQATLWVPESFPLIFLPLGIPDRVTDILRGYAALACLWSNGRTLGYASPVVRQERNPHNLFKDFEQEIDLYRHSVRWVDELHKTSTEIGMGRSFEAALRLLANNGEIPHYNLDAYSQFRERSERPEQMSQQKA